MAHIPPAMGPIAAVRPGSLNGIRVDVTPIAIGDDNLQKAAMTPRNCFDLLARASPNSCVNFTIL
jgi:hypothetical protein